MLVLGRLREAGVMCDSASNRRASGNGIVKAESPSGIGQDTAVKDARKMHLDDRAWRLLSARLGCSLGTR